MVLFIIGGFAKYFHLIVSLVNVQKHPIQLQISDFVSSTKVQNPPSLSGGQQNDVFEKLEQQTIIKMFSTASMHGCPPKPDMLKLCHRIKV